MTTTNTKKITNYEEIYDVLMRDKNVEFYVYECLIFEGIRDKKQIVNIVKDIFPDEYKEALSIASDPDRKIVRIYEDELEYFVKKFEKTKWEKNGFQNLIHDFLLDHNLRNEFYQYVDKLNNEYDDGYFGDLEKTLEYFKN